MPCNCKSQGLPYSDSESFLTWEDAPAGAPAFEASWIPTESFGIYTVRFRLGSPVEKAFKQKGATAGTMTKLNSKFGVVTELFDLGGELEPKGALRMPRQILTSPNRYSFAFQGHYGFLCHNYQHFVIRCITGDEANKIAHKYFGWCSQTVICDGKRC